MKLLAAGLILFSLMGFAAEPHGKQVPQVDVHREIDSSPRPNEFVFDVTDIAKAPLQEFVDSPEIAMYTPTEVSD